ncbi:MAG: family 1 glycosylhydrolase [Gemmatimonadota bacterium]|nr:family 1 glycosylhydrolase [Gemmatimonadota bacterium]
MTGAPAEGTGVGTGVGAALELWGGVECTVSRVQDAYIDQVEQTGHATRDGDLDRIADLGIKTLRYPVLWERVAPRSLSNADWSWTDRRLGRLRELGVEPIFGLMHHGSGPTHTWLGDPSFPDKLARYAGVCAQRYPWIKWVTPVNEPLTTARFSGLYGHWYPHHQSDRRFVRMLLNQCLAVRAAMRSIRAVAPDARLMQTEDLGHIHAGARLRYQAQFENERRWLTWDLLCGRVVAGHPLRPYLLANGASYRELHDLAAHPCPPDLIGIDYYVTSERYLDDQVDRYDGRAVGGNGIHQYADVDVARVDPGLRRGLASLMCETWERYQIPITVSEAHLSCDDEVERVRWLMESWNAAITARYAGCDVRSVTAWALFGACGWDSLATTPNGRYEAGAFDVSGAIHGVPRATRLTAAIASLARKGYYTDSALSAPGWWEATHRDSQLRRVTVTA